MRGMFFPRLAFTGIKKNSKLYVPYIISCIGCVAINYIIDFLSNSPAVKSVSAGSSLSVILSMGKFVVAAFSLIFLFYTNSFIIRRRYREFGLYNILGMDKSGISRIILCEALAVCVISLSAGLFFGIILSKLAEITLLYIVRSETSFTFSVSLASVKFTLIIFAIIFLLLLFKSLIQVRKTDAIELMKNERTGEKAPKANWVVAVIGAVILIAAYLIALLTKSPLDAVSSFLVAVIMVIIATYMLFISGSVALCRVLQKNKKYYYKKNHFVSVSSMTYRMKRNGAGLASICILSTMVLVMIASSASLYFGADDAIKGRFKDENQISAYLHDIGNMDDAHFSAMRENYDRIFKEEKVTPKKVSEYRFSRIVGLIEKDEINPDSSRVVNGIIVYDNLRDVYFINQSDYNRVMNKSLNLNKGEAMVYPLRCSYDEDKLKMDSVELKIVGKLDEMFSLDSENVGIIPSLIFVISDFSDIEALDSLKDFNGDRMLDLVFYFGYDIDGDTEKITDVFKKQRDGLLSVDFLKNSHGGYSYSSDCLYLQREDFYMTYGGLFFIGILLSIVFIFAMAMIIYYKQISEGYEDCARFNIMRNVGMTKKDITKSINSQTLTVFFAPLITSGIHLCFAFPPIWKLLMLFHINNLRFVIIVTVCVFLLFGLFYTALYKVTSNAYYSIVSEKRE